MLVVDSNVVLAMPLREPEREASEALLRFDPIWIAPMIIWYEIHNVLLFKVRGNEITQERARDEIALSSALLHMIDPTQIPLDIWGIAHDAELTFYDATYVALARHMGTRLATNDQRILAGAPDVAALPSEISA